MSRAVARSPQAKAAFSDDDDIVTWGLSMTTMTESLLNQLARDIGGSREDVLKRALALLSVAVKARQEGKGLAIVDREGHIDTEITGI